MNLFHQMIGISIIQRVDQPMSRFLVAHGGDCDISVLAKAQEALEGHEPIIESLEYDQYMVDLLYLKMSQAWPRPIDNGINALEVFQGSAPIKWHEKIGYAFLPKSIFKYMAFLELEKFGFIESSKKWQRTGFTEDAQPSTWHSDAKLFLLNQSKDSLNGHPLASFIYKMFFSSFQHNGVFKTQLSFDAYLEKGAKSEAVLKNLRRLVVTNETLINESKDILSYEN